MLLSKLDILKDTRRLSHSPTNYITCGYAYLKLLSMSPLLFVVSVWSWVLETILNLLSLYPISKTQSWIYLTMKSLHVFRFYLPSAFTVPHHGSVNITEEDLLLNVLTEWYVALNSWKNTCTCVKGTVQKWKFSHYLLVRMPCDGCSPWSRLVPPHKLQALVRHLRSYMPQWTLRLKTWHKWRLSEKFGVSRL